MIRQDQIRRNYNRYPSRNNFQQPNRIRSRIPQENYYDGTYIDEDIPNVRYSNTNFENNQGILSDKISEQSQQSNDVRYEKIIKYTKVSIVHY